jgi:hypothetical protein
VRYSTLVVCSVKPESAPNTVFIWVQDLNDDKEAAQPDVHMKMQRMVSCIHPESPKKTAATYNLGGGYVELAAV